MKRMLIIFSALAFLLTSANTSSAQSNKGLEIAQAADQADQGFGSIVVELNMQLKNANGQTSSRKLVNKTLELTEDGDKSLIVFNSPKDVKGTSMLTYSHKEGSDDQWLFLPSIKRVKRISSNNKSGPFMGSEFAYEDLSSQEVEKYSYNFLQEDNINGDKAYVVERDPVDPKSGYKKQIVWYNADKGYRLEKIEYYDRKGALLKTLIYNDYNQYKGKHWRASEMVMTNHQSNKETTLSFSDYQFKVGYTDNDFSQNSLKRAGR
ncbi:MAG: outer membrane lipoprotein-sorting protein [Bacteroidota bacterium]